MVGVSLTGGSSARLAAAALSTLRRRSSSHLCRLKPMAGGRHGGALEHDPEKWIPVSEKIMLQRKI
jgi:hypothetical protein